MSDLNIALASMNSVGLEKENLKQEAVQARAVNPNPINKEIEGKEAPLTEHQMTETVKDMNNLLQDMNRNLSFTVDDQSGESVIVVKDSESDEVIRQIPSEELVILRKKMDDVVGILFDTKV